MGKSGLMVGMVEPACKTCAKVFECKDPIYPNKLICDDYIKDVCGCSNCVCNS